MEHSFDVSVARDVGIVAATIIRQLVTISQMPDDKESDLDRAVIPESSDLWDGLFPYCKANAISAALSKLQAEGYIMEFGDDQSENYLYVTDKAMEAHHIEKPKDHSKGGRPNKLGELGELLEARNKRRAEQDKEAEALFNRFWVLYPRKLNKVYALRVWLKLPFRSSPQLFDAIMDGLRRAKAYDHRFLDERFTPYAATWLNSKGWENEYEIERKALANQTLKAVSDEGCVPPPEMR